MAIKVKFSGYLKDQMQSDVFKEEFIKAKEQLEQELFSKTKNDCYTKEDGKD